MRKTFSLTLIAIAAAFVATPAWAVLYVNSDFSTLANGNLVGQGGWTATGASVIGPLTVSGGKVVVPQVTGAVTVDNQDAYKAFPALISAPGVGTTTVYAGIDMSVQAAGAAGPSYFLAIDNATDGTGFDNFRIGVKASGAGFVLSARITGQATDPFTDGATVLSFNTPLKLVAKYDMIAGAANDVISLFVNPTTGDLSGDSPYLTHVIGASATDPTAVGAFIISQFHSSGSNSAGYTLGRIVVASTAAEAVPEASSFLFAGLALCVGGTAVAHRRRRTLAPAVA